MANPGLGSIPRHELIAAALSLGIPKPESLTSEQLTRRIQLASERGDLPPESKHSWFEVARHLVASVMGQGLNMPQAARLILGPKSAPKQRPPLPTVTLAQIYLAQGHTDRARVTLSFVLSREPHNTKARSLLENIERGASGEAVSPGPSQPVEPEPERISAAPDAEAAAAEPDRVASPAATERNEPEAGKSASKVEIIAVARVSSATPVSPAKGSVADDAVVVIRERDVAHVCWDLSARTAQRLDSEALCLMLTTVKPSWDGARLVQTEVPLTVSSGSYEFPCTSELVVRAAVGAATASGPRALAVASTCAVTGTRLSLQFSPRPGVDDSAVAERAWSRMRSA